MADVKSDANKVIKALDGIYNRLGGWMSISELDTITVTKELLKSQRAEIERLQPKKGHWEMKADPYGFFDEIPVCSECGCTNKLRKKTAFCDHCGADMREGDGE